MNHAGQVEHMIAKHQGHQDQIASQDAQREANRRSHRDVFLEALTPTEIIAAWKAGSDFVELFPTAPMSGPDCVYALELLLVQIPLIVTGGVNQLTVLDSILAGASGIGVGTELLRKEALRHHEEQRIHELAQRFITVVDEVRVQRDSS